MLLLKPLYVFGFVGTTTTNIEYFTSYSRAHTHTPTKFSSILMWILQVCEARTLTLHSIHAICLGMPIVHYIGIAAAAQCTHVKYICTLKCCRFNKNAVFDRAPEARPIIIMVNTITYV